MTGGVFASTYVDGSVHVTPAELGRRAAGVHALLGVQAEGPVIVAVSNRSRIVASIAACLQAGRTCCLPNGLSAGSIAAVARVLPNALVLHDLPDRPGLRADQAPSEPGAHLDFAEVCARHLDDPRILFSTSGSTGEPRLVPKSPRQLLDEAVALAALLGVQDGQRVGLGVPSTHLFGFLFGIALPSVRALTVHDPIVRTIDAGTDAPRFDLLALSPPTAQAVARSAGSSGLEGCTVVASGSSLAVSIVDELREAGAWNVVELYGSTETGGVGHREAPNISFRPLPGVCLATHDERVHVSSPYARTDGSSVAVADILSIDSDGSFRFVERAEDRVKVGGRRISIGEVEAALRETGAIDAVVRPRTASVARGHRLAALVVSPDVDAMTLRAKLASRLDVEFVPRPILVVPRIARTPAGKVTAASFDRQYESALRAARAGMTALSDGDDVTVVQVPMQSPRFEGHFPGAPILPGVSMLLDIVLPVIHSMYADVSDVRRMTRVKFTHPVRPGDRLLVRVERRSIDQLRFVVTLSGGTPVSSGTLHLHPPIAELSASP